MCGICGKVNFNQQNAQESLLKQMCRSFSYRGPDDEGIYIFRSNGVAGKQQPCVGFGHQRLSIIDLTDAGRQPMSNEDGTIWITYNGEIYNYRELADELKKKGHQFKSDTDTEVVLHLYEEEGPDAVNRLNGMFAFAIWDENINRLWICRDRIGIKPLVYYWDGEHFTFASEIWITKPCNCILHLIMFRHLIPFLRALKNWNPGNICFYRMEILKSKLTGNPPMQLIQLSPHFLLKTK
jgi:asparagine synthase (glutamine-hydrolysing)